MSIDLDTARALADQFMAGVPADQQPQLACRTCGGTGKVPAMTDCFDVQCYRCHGSGFPSPYRNSKE